MQIETLHWHWCRSGMHLMMKCKIRDFYFTSRSPYNNRYWFNWFIPLYHVPLYHVPGVKILIWKKGKYWYENSSGWLSTRQWAVLVTRWEKRWWFWCFIKLLNLSIFNLNTFWKCIIFKEIALTSVGSNDLVQSIWYTESW